MIEIWKEIGQIKSGRKELREFGITIGSILVVIAGAMLWRGRGSCLHIFAIGGLFIALGIFSPSWLKPLQKLWMSFAVVLGFFMSRVILFLLFYGVITPIGFMMKIAGKDPLDERIDTKRTSYWNKRPEEAKNRESYEKQF